MNEKNLEYLKNDLKFLGFGDKMNAELENVVQSQPDKFKLMWKGEFTKPDGKDEVKYVLDYKKSGTTENYFLNHYDATLKHDDPTQEKTQRFYITKGSGITAKEAYNLLSGRAVNKNLTNKGGEPFNAWVQIDFSEKDKHENFKLKQFHQGYGYDLATVLAKYPIKELADPNEKIKVMRSLEKGNLQQVMFNPGGVSEKMFIEANPQYKNVNVYNAKLEKQHQGVEKKEQEPEKSKEKKESIKPESDDEESSKKEGKRKRKGVGI